MEESVSSTDERVVLVSDELSRTGLPLGPDKGKADASWMVRAGLSWGANSYAALHARRAVLLQLHRTLAHAFDVQAVARADGTWIFDALQANGEEAVVPGGPIDFRALATTIPETAVLYDSREEAVYLSLPEWDNLLTIAPSPPTEAPNSYADLTRPLPWFAPFQGPPSDVISTASVEHTPDIRTVPQLEALFSVDATAMIKSLVAICEGTQRGPVPVLCALRGDQELSLDHLTALVGCATSRLASESEVRELTGCTTGFAGPFPTDKIADVVFDVSCPIDRPVICGVHREDYHLVNAILGVDIAPPAFVYQISTTPPAESREPSFRVFWLRDLYDDLVSALEQDSASRSRRPFDVVMVPARASQTSDARSLGEELIRSQDVAVLVDDRPGSFGSRMMDWELLRPAYTVVLGRRFADGYVEVGNGASERHDVAIGELWREIASAADS